jgi:Sensors of blue-light using FAD
MLVRLLYASRAAKAVDQEELGAILRQAKANNHKQGITGALCLCRNGGVFMQVLEGSREAVNRLYNRIITDPRHTDVVLLGYEEIPERRFASWTMGQVNMSRLNPALVLKYSPAASPDPFSVSGATSMALFDELVAAAAISQS